jgi:hypothetical protein
MAHGALFLVRHACVPRRSGRLTDAPFASASRQQSNRLLGQPLGTELLMPGQLYCRVDKDGYPALSMDCDKGPTCVRPCASSSVFACDYVNPFCGLLSLCARLCNCLFGCFKALSVCACSCAPSAGRCSHMAASPAPLAAVGGSGNAVR